MTGMQMMLVVLSAAGATVLTRALPFLAFPAGRETPAVVRYLGQALPGAVFGLLVVYCLKDVDMFTGAHGIPEAIGILIAGGTYLWRRSMLVSILSSTIVYMLLVNLVF